MTHGPLSLETLSPALIAEVQNANAAGLPPGLDPKVAARLGYSDGTVARVENNLGSFAVLPQAGEDERIYPTVESAPEAKSLTRAENIKRLAQTRAENPGGDGARHVRVVENNRLGTYHADRPPTIPLANPIRPEL
ncbi:MAG: hypothetical protein ACI9T8_000275 [Candidatus Saccharimonadales bacterium]|jgi:hypothetical protein